MQAEQDKAVALAEKHFGSYAHEAKSIFTAMLADHKQQVRDEYREELVAKAGKMPRVYEEDMCDNYCVAYEVREAIAAMQAQRQITENKLALAEEAGKVLSHNYTLRGEKLEQSEERVAELEKDTAQVGWLIEFTPKVNGPHWLDHKCNFTKDSLKSLRFARKEDAEAFLDLLYKQPGRGTFSQMFKGFFKLGKRELWKVTEHMWIDAAMNKEQP